MALNLEKIIATTLQVGAGMPAYRALFDQVVDLFHEDDQAILKDRLAEAMAVSDAQHKAAQSL